MYSSAYIFIESCRLCTTALEEFHILVGLSRKIVANYDINLAHNGIHNN